ncbi:zinc finger MYM-type protein 1 [Trichonephila clavipes]|nr:zinc finger MYM-type protein 1 [Trichonephila clavipes]
MITSTVDVSCTLIGPPLLKSRPPLQAQVSKTMNIRVPDRDTGGEREGCCDWKDLSRILQRHEQSQGHMECMIKWMEFYKGIKHGKKLDKDNERLIKESQKYWDVSHVEQMSIILRFCNSSTGAIEEHFVGFIAFAETTGEYITNSILQELERNGLDIQNCRGQGYDNDANMVGWESRIGAVKAIFLQLDDISKLWQSVQVNLKVTFDTLRSFCSWIQEFRNTGFDNSVAQARLFVEKSSFEIESQFKEKRTARKKRMFG